MTSTLCEEMLQETPKCPADRIRKFESELRETKVVTPQSKQIWLATMNDDVESGAAQIRGGEDGARKKDMQRHYKTKLTEMAQDRDAARPTNHDKALQEETKSEEPKDRHSDGLEKFRQEVARMAQEK